MSNEATVWRPLSATHRVIFEAPVTSAENEYRTLPECLRKVAEYIEEKRLQDCQIDGIDLVFERVVEPDEGDYRWEVVLSHEPAPEP